MIVYLVSIEVRGSDVDVEQVVAAGELQRTGFRQRPASRLEDVGDVLGAEGLEGEPVGDGARHEIGGIDLGQSQDLAQVMAGVQPALLQAIPIGLRVWRRRCCSIASFLARLPQLAQFVEDKHLIFQEVRSERSALQSYAWAGTPEVIFGGG